MVLHISCNTIPTSCSAYRVGTETSVIGIGKPNVWSWDSSVVYELGYSLEDRGFVSGQRKWIFLFITVPRLALESTKPPIQWVPWALSLGVKWPERETDQSPPTSAEVKNASSCTSTPPIRLHGVELRDKRNISSPCSKQSCQGSPCSG
jgi:hypothetical protein